MRPKQRIVKDIVYITTYVNGWPVVTPTESTVIYYPKATQSRTEVLRQYAQLAERQAEHQRRMAEYQRKLNEDRAKRLPAKPAAKRRKAG
ncbi:MAG: hypothetical protein IT462_04100 [Planctomycetes bacterium]|nr:hypothetical protein [Planctomycetota bacterium]